MAGDAALSPFAKQEEITIFAQRHIKGATFDRQRYYLW